MKNISELANSLQENTNQQAKSTKEIVANELTDLNNFIKNCVRKSKKTINDDIHDQNRQMKKLLWTSWRNAALTVICILLLAQGLIWYQGKMIKDRWSEIANQNKKIEQLKDLGGIST